MAAQASDGPRVRVAALIVIDGKVVLVRHRAGSSRYHLLPGGGVDYRETMGDALTREVREETGLDVELAEPVLLSDTIDPKGSRHVVNIVFRAEVTGGAPSVTGIDERVEGVDLVAPQELSALDLRPPLAEQLRSIINGTQHGALYAGSVFKPA